MGCAACRGHSAGVLCAVVVGASLLVARRERSRAGRRGALLAVLPVDDDTSAAFAAL